MKTDMIKYTMQTLAGVLLFAFAACQDDIDNGISSEEGQAAIVNLSLTTVPLEDGMAETKAIPENLNVNEIKDLWLIEYDHKGTIIGSPKYYTDNDLNSEEGMSVPIILPDDDLKVYKFVVVANTHSEILEAALGDVTTLEKMKALTMTINSQEDLCKKGNDLIMNGVMDLKSNTTELECKLYRNVAKLSFEVKNAAGSGVQINTVRLCNVPNVIYLADRLYDNETNIPSHAVASFISYQDAVELSENSEMTFTYLMPRNCRGTNESALASNKNVNVPDFSTYFEIDAVEVDTGIPLRYRFYPGANTINDFNISSNRHYIMPININGPGDSSTDNRVERFESVVLEESNSYIINPLNNIYQQHYCVPTTRINVFWDSKDGKKALNSEGTPEDNVLHEDTEWIAEVIWQDQPERLIDFCDRTGRVTNTKADDTYKGRGLNYFYFKPRQGAMGNVVIGVRKTTGSRNDYLWSWHLWITDYNPDQAANSGWQTGKYIYSVDGGEIHRYKGSAWNTKYKDKYIMDCNIGAITNHPEDPKDADRNRFCRGLFWQYGNKNPIPHISTNIYNINGVQLVRSDLFTTTKEQASAIYQMVKKPCTIFVGQLASYNHWCEDYNYRTWYNPTWYTPGPSGKTLFDPSPAGWKLIESNDVWSCFQGGGKNVNGGSVAFPNADSDFSCMLEVPINYIPRRSIFALEKGYYFYISDNPEDKAWYCRAHTYSTIEAQTQSITGNYMFVYRNARNSSNTVMQFTHYTYSGSGNIGLSETGVLRCIKE